MSGPVNPYQNPYPRHREPDIRFDVIGEMWKYVSSNWGAWITAALVALVPSGIVIGIGYAVVLIPIITSGRDPGIGGQLLLFPFILIGMALSGAGMLSMARMAIKCRRGQALESGDATYGLKHLVPAGLIALLVTIGIYIGSFLCVIPGLLVGGLTLGAYAARAENESASPWECIQKSIDVFKPKMWMALVLYLVLGIIGGLGVYVCLVGALVSIPIYVGGAALAFLDMQGEATVPTETQTF